MFPSADDCSNVPDDRVPAMHNILIGQPNHHEAQSRRDPVSRSVYLILGEVVLSAVRFDDEPIAHKKIDAPYSRNHHLSAQVDSRGPQSQSDDRLGTRFALGVATLGKIVGCEPRRCHDRFGVGHLDHPLVQHRVQHNDEPLRVETVRRRRHRDFRRIDGAEDGWVQTVRVAGSNSGARPARSCGVANVQSGIGNPHAAQAQSRHAGQCTSGRDGADNMSVGGRTGVPTPPHRQPALRKQRVDLRSRPPCRAQLGRGYDSAIRCDDALDLGHHSIAAHQGGGRKGAVADLWITRLATS